jgi:hypothetical protein
VAGPTSTTIREYTRRWVWEFHETVNMKNGYSSGIQLADLPRLYSVNMNITNLLGILEQIGNSDYEVFKRHLLKLF